MRIRKKLIPLLFSALLALPFTGCQDKQTYYQPAETTTEAVITTEEVTTTAEVTTEEVTTEEATTEEVTTEEATIAAEVPAAREPGAIWYINADSLNVRTAPTTDAEAIGQLFRGEQALILSIEGEWFQVMAGNLTGYINSNYCVSTYAETGLSDNPQAQSPNNPTEANTPAPETQASQSANGNGHIICIDAGHQAYGISEQEPNGPGSSVMKAKLTTGTQGCSTGLTEYQLNLDVALILKQELINRGYTVVMIRESNDCPQSNAERAQAANASGAEAFIRIHANSSDNASVAGAMAYSPSPANPYMNADVINSSIALSNTILNAFCQTTGLANRGQLQDDTMTGINWSSVPVTIIEMGFMSNPEEDQWMAANEGLMAAAIANGLDTYFGL